MLTVSAAPSGALVPDRNQLTAVCRSGHSIPSRPLRDRRSPSLTVGVSSRGLCLRPFRLIQIPGHSRARLHRKGQFDFAVEAGDSSSPNPQTAAKALILSVAPTVQITTWRIAERRGRRAVPGLQWSLPAGYRRTDWTVAGALPPGLSLNTSSGAIAGTPTQAGTSTFSVVLMDSADQTARKSSSITIVAAGPPTSGGIVISPSVPPTVNQGGDFFSLRQTRQVPGRARELIHLGYPLPARETSTL